MKGLFILKRKSPEAQPDTAVTVHLLSAEDISAGESVPGFTCGLPLTDVMWLRCGGRLSSEPLTVEMHDLKKSSVFSEMHY